MPNAVTLPIGPDDFYIDNTKYGTITIDVNSNLIFADLQTPPVSQTTGPLNINTQSGAITQTTIDLTINSVNYDRITGNFSDNASGSGKIHVTRSIDATEADWSTDETTDEPLTKAATQG
jgi:hypothetical protein